uniref:Protein kinase domain-containing protein n=1 Tax=Heterorhabditis bacteriophora TaxID=37862 RepID=A0A1I7XFY4_HETBA
MRPDGSLIRRRGSGPCVGTFPYSPLASATMRDQAPKDDLEGWMYMMFEMVNERPKYQQIHRLLMTAVRRLDIPLDVPYDWQVFPSLISLVQKSTWSHLPGNKD